MDGEIVKESLQEGLCGNRNEITQCIDIALRNHEMSNAEWFKYVDDKSGPDELALYSLSHKHGIHTSVFNKSYVWTTLTDHVNRSDEEIIALYGVNLVFVVLTLYFWALLLMVFFVIFTPHSQNQIQLHYDLWVKHRNEIAKLPVQIVHVAIKQVTSVANDMVTAVMVKDYKH